MFTNNHFYKRLLFLLIAIFFFSCKKEHVSPPKPFGIVPHERQIAWHDLEFYAFIHFTINTFTDKEWGFGDESPTLFNPSEFNAEQIVRTAKNAGMKGLVLTAKHHDGFCLWPTKTTEHNISKSPYKNGEGDIVQEIADACRKYDIKLGLYLSPWDRNNADYGKPEYVETFRAQLTELLTNYGDVFEVWFDGANGGDGYYGGANEKRQIDRSTYYDWENTYALVRELQPNAVIFSDVGPDVRWVGTEAGYSGDPCWHRFTPEGLEPGVEPAPGQIKYWESLNGTREGKFWLPAETNTSIRPGWFYHESENDQVKSPEKLVDTHYASIGHGTSFILNLTPDKRGLIPDTDISALNGFKAILDSTFKTNLAEGSSISASNVRGTSKKYSANNLLDTDNTTYWAVEDSVKKPSVVVNFPKETTFNVVNIREYIPLGQRVWGWALDRWENNEWVEFAAAESIGNRRLWRGSLQTTKKIRLRITDAGAAPILSTLSVHKEPVRLTPPKVYRDTTGLLYLESNGKIKYTLDNTEPNTTSKEYLGPTPFVKGGILKTKTLDGDKESETQTSLLGYSPNKWSCIDCLNNHAIDENSSTQYSSPNKELIVDFGEVLNVSQLLMTPATKGKKEGMVLNYAYYGSTDKTNWTLLAKGEFSNIFNNPIMQVTPIEKTSMKYLKLVAERTVADKPLRIGELSVVVD